MIQHYHLKVQQEKKERQYFLHIKQICKNQQQQLSNNQIRSFFIRLIDRIEHQQQKIRKQLQQYLVDKIVENRNCFQKTKTCQLQNNDNKQQITKTYESTQVVQNIKVQQKERQDQEQFYKRLNQQIKIKNSVLKQTSLQIGQIVQKLKKPVLVYEFSQMFKHRSIDLISRQKIQGKDRIRGKICLCTPAINLNNHDITNKISFRILRANVDVLIGVCNNQNARKFSYEIQRWKQIVHYGGYFFNSGGYVYTPSSHSGNINDKCFKFKQGNVVSIQYLNHTKQIILSKATEEESSVFQGFKRRVNYISVRLYIITRLLYKQQTEKRMENRFTTLEYKKIDFFNENQNFISKISIQGFIIHLLSLLYNMNVVNKVRKLSYMISSIKTKFIDYKAGPAENLFLNQRQIKVGDGQHLIKIKAVGINRAQCLHRLGRYPINNEIQKNIGLEAAGQIIDPSSGLKLFDGIALLSGGSYAQWTVAPKTHVMQLPKNLNYKQGAAIPEAWLTAFQLLGLAQMKKGQKVVIYAGASGVGTAAIQICRVLGYQPFAVVSIKQKGQICEKLGVKGVAYYKDNENWADELIKFNDGKTFDAVLDCVGPGNAKYTTKLLKLDGRWVFYGTLSGIKGQVNFGQLIGKRIKLISTTLKTRSKQYKDDLINNFKQKVLKQFQTQKVKPVISQVIKCDWSSAQSFIKAHQIMQSNQNAGKIIIQYN